LALTSQSRCSRYRRSGWLRALTEELEPGCEIGMEACSGAHHWARQLRSRGFEVKLIPPQYVKPYVKTQKNDASDAEAICEAMSRPGMRFVAVKTVEQQDIQAIHRVRSSVVGQRTAQANQIRGLVAEYGLWLPNIWVACERRSRAGSKMPKTSSLTDSGVVTQSVDGATPPGRAGGCSRSRDSGDRRDAS
jgi:hypothetical protein